MKLSLGAIVTNRIDAELKHVDVAVKRATPRSINRVAAVLATQSRRDIGAQINLSQTFIREQMSVSRATTDRPVAYIRYGLRAVRLARFAANQLTRVAPRAKGDTRRAIAAGRKQAGVSVKVRKSGPRARIRRAFLLPLSDDNVFGVFVRTGRQRKEIKQLFGPSPDQLFQRWAKQKQPDVRRMVNEAFERQLRYELSRKRK